MIVFFDMFSGISGDMTLGALIDLGVPPDWLEKQLYQVVSGFQLKTGVVYKNYLKATDVIVDVFEEESVSRNYTDIKNMIQNSFLPEKVKENSLAAFKKIAEAESHIHGQDIETIHFHEIGGIDSIVDVIGSFLCIHCLGIEKVYASAVPLGSGSVKCSHGRIPVPVPATLEILKNIPVKKSDAETEIVTPTGAAIIATLASSFGSMPDMAVKKTGYGAGKKETGSSLPNLLRIVSGSQQIMQNATKKGIQKEKIYVAKTDVDDMNPEISGFLMELLFENNALDVCFVPVFMKKNRPGVQIQVICRKKDMENIVSTIFAQTSSIGVRYHECERSFLLRQNAFVQTRFGELQVKKITNPDLSVSFVPEYDVAKKVAQKNSIALKEVYQKIACDGNKSQKSVNRGTKTQ